MPRSCLVDAFAGKFDKHARSRSHLACQYLPFFYRFSISGFNFGLKLCKRSMFAYLSWLQLKLIKLQFRKSQTMSKQNLISKKLSNWYIRHIFKEISCLNLTSYQTNRLSKILRQQLQCAKVVQSYFLAANWWSSCLNGVFKNSWHTQSLAWVCNCHDNYQLPSK